MSLARTRLLCTATILVLSSNLAAAHEQAVIALNSENFEHATQAASGQTTGFWHVYFGKEDAAADQQMWRTYAEQQREASPWLLHAFVDVDTNPDLAERFGIKSTPAFLLFRNRKMYRFKSDYVSRIDPAVVRGLTEFAGHGWRSAKAEKVPHDKRLHKGISRTALVIIIGSLALLAAFAGMLGNQFRSYYEATKPEAAKHPKGQ